MVVPQFRVLADTELSNNVSISFLFFVFVFMFFLRHAYPLGYINYFLLFVNVLVLLDSKLNFVLWSR